MLETYQKRNINESDALPEKQTIVELADWLNTDPGRYMQNWEQSRINAVVSDVFGYHALQVGLPQTDLLAANRMPHKAWAAPLASRVCADIDSANLVFCRPEALPFDSQSLDLLVLSHGLTLTDDPHQILREVERVLVPEGRVVISGFNPWSLWGLRHRLPYLSASLPYPKDAGVSLSRLKDWFKLLSFDIDRGYFGCYVPPCLSQKWISRFGFMEHAGDRWWPVFGAMYVVSAVKRVAGMRLIKSAWTRKYRRRVAAAATGVALNTRKEGDQT